MNKRSRLNIYIKLSVVLFLYTLFFILNSVSAHAQQVSLSLSPSLTEIAVKPGQSVLTEFTFKNTGDPAIIKFRVEPLNKKTGDKIIFDLNNTDVRLEEQYFFKNSDSKELFLGIRIPEQIQEKDYYFNFIAESLPPPTQEGTVNIRAKITLLAPLLITVTREGVIEIKPKISMLEVVPKYRFNFLGFKFNLIDSFQPIPVVLEVSNKGKNLIKAGGELTVRGPFWQSKNYEFSPQIILAESQSRMNIKTDNPNRQDSTSLLLPGLFAGKYNLSTVLTFGEGTPTLYSTMSFIVLPFKLISVTVPVLIITYFLLRKIKKTREKMI